MKRRLLLILSLLLPLVANAYDVQIDGIYYKFSGNEATVIYRDRSLNSYSGNVVIPASVTYNSKTYSVTKINYDAFSGCRGLTSVTIPNSVTSIGSKAFFGCSGLKVFYCYAENVPNTYYSAFEESPINTAKLRVPIASIGSYKTTSPWSGFGRIISINAYDLTYIVDGNKYKMYEVEKDSPITPEPEPIKEGYTFSGWSEIPETMPASDVVVTGTFTINQYVVKFLDWDGTVISETEQDYHSAITLPINPVREGYTFTGWDTEVPSVVPAHDVIFKATYSINSYMLTYMVDGAVYKTSSIVYGGAITPEDVPIKEGHTFSGWSEIPETMPAHDVVVNGSFAVNKYTLTYAVDGEEYKTLTLDYGTIITPEAEPSREGYTFSGWSEMPETMPAHDVTITGSFTINQYILTYILDGEKYKSYKLDYNTPINPESIPVKKGMTFSGWGEVPETMPAHDVTITGTCSWMKETCDDIIYQVADTLNNYASVVGYEEINGGAEILSNLKIGEYTYTINCIGSNAFNGCTGLTSVIVPECVTSIGDNAFYGCSSLMSVTLESDAIVSVSRTTSTSLRYIFGEQVKTYVIGKAVKNIGNFAFYNCNGMASVTIGTGVLSIGNNAFSNASPKKVIWLTNTPPNGYQNLVGAVNYAANNQYSNLTNVIVYPYLSSMFEVDGVKYVPVSPSERTCDAIDCYYIESTQNINIGETVTYRGVSLAVKQLGPYLFYRNPFINNLNISFNGDVGACAFYGCSELQTTILGQGITSIGEKAFEDCSKMENIVIPNAVISIGNNAFENCSAMTSVEIGDNVKTIPAYAFSGCSSLTDMKIGTAVASINTYAFSGCSSLTDIQIPQNITTIEDYVFSGCTGLKNVLMDDGDTELKLGSNGSSPLFASCPLDSVYIGRNITYPTASDKGYSPFYNNKSLRSVIITDKETEITTNEFKGCSGLKSAKLEACCAIGNGAFQDCNSLTELEIGNKEYSDYEDETLVRDYIPSYDSTNYGLLDNIENKAYVEKEGPDVYEIPIGDYAFSGCSQLQEVILPEPYTSIGSNTFQNCTALNSIKIGSGITSIGNAAFSGCSSLPTIDIPQNVTVINDNSFVGCGNLNFINMEDSEQELALGSNGSSPLFNDCPLDSVYIGRNISYSTTQGKGYSPFYRNRKLRSVTITDKETEISPNEFYGCTNLKNVSIGDGVTTIGDWAFSGCSSLEEFKFGSKVEHIGKEAFSDCISVKNLVSQANTPPSCGQQALEDINKWDCVLFIPQGTLDAYKSADQWKDFFFIEEKVDEDAIGEVKASEKRIEVARYDAQGHRLSAPQKGINVIRYSDGTSRKVLVK